VGGEFRWRVGVVGGVQEGMVEEVVEEEVQGIVEGGGEEERVGGVGGVGEDGEGGEGRKKGWEKADDGTVGRYERQRV
uniref:hypothetical protein n=1 Tax=Kocuria salsicia TaxID=664639 RepID=UPI001C92BA89